MEIETITVVMGVAGMVLLYGAVKNKNPLEVIKLALQGKDISKASPISIPRGDPDNLTAGPGAVPGGSLPGTPQADGDARTDPKGFDPKTDDILPVLPEERRYQGGTYGPIV